MIASIAHDAPEGLGTAHNPGVLSHRAVAAEGRVFSDQEQGVHDQRLEW